MGLCANARRFNDTTVYTSIVNDHGKKMLSLSPSPLLWYPIIQGFTTIKNPHTHRQTCGPSHERRWRQQVVLNPHWCCSCGVVDTSQTDETDPGSHRAGSFQHRCLSWWGWGSNYVYTCHISTIRGSSIRAHHLPFHLSTKIVEPQMHVCVCHLPGDQHSHVVMGWVCVTLGIEVFLPSTETGQSGVCMMNNLQPFLQHTAELERSFWSFLASFGLFFLHSVMLEQLEISFDTEENISYFHRGFRVQCQLQSSNL